MTERRQARPLGAFESLRVETGPARDQAGRHRMLGTGVRVGEALAVDWADVDLVAGTVTVEHTLIRLKGIGLVRKSTKSEAGERVLRLPRFLVTMLRDRNLVGRIDGPVFPDSLGGWRDPSNTSRDLRLARGSDGFAWVTSHVFRKTCATILDAAGQTPAPSPTSSATHRSR